MEQKEIDLSILEFLVQEAKKYCCIVAFVGDVNTRKDNIDSIHLLCVIEEGRINSEKWRWSFAEDAFRNSSLLRASFENFKEQMENFSFNDYVANWHGRFPLVKLIIEEVSRDHF